MPKYLKQIVPHTIVMIVFIIAALAYFSPVLQGKKIFQSDIYHHIGMAEQYKEFKKETGEKTYWSNSAFGGMPTYLVGARYDNNYIKKLDLAIRFLPRPADYLFLYFVGFYILLLVLKVDYKLAALGALTFGFSTYMIIILGVGHNSKAHAIAYMPLALSGILLTFRKYYFYGFLLTTVGLGLQIVANHFQMTYYLLIMVIIIGFVYLIDSYEKISRKSFMKTIRDLSFGNVISLSTNALKFLVNGFDKKVLKDFLKAVTVIAFASVIAVGLNSTSMLATQDYVTHSTRGKSPLTIKPDGSIKEKTVGLSRDYITQFSYGITETLNLFIPRFMGGGTYEELGKDSEVYKAYINLGASPIQALEASKQSPTYWGNQPIIEGPAYVGAVVIFLFIVSLFLIHSRLKWWALAAIFISLLLSYGKNLPFLTDFFIDYVPLYNKFRAVSSIQVILELCIPIMAIIGLSKFYKSKAEDKNEQLLKALKYSFIIAGGICLLILLFQSSFDYSGLRDSRYREAYGKPFIKALIEDRQALLMADTLRTLAFVSICAGILLLYIKNKLSKNILVFLVGSLILVDLIAVNLRYVNSDGFIPAIQVDKPYQANDADKQILKDKSHFRVLDVTAMSESAPAKASYYHNSLLGYHAAKPGRYNELLEFYIYEGNRNVLNMLNTKYIIDDDGGTEKPYVNINDEANGNAWFVSKIIEVVNEDKEMLALDTLNNKINAVMPRGLLESYNLEKIYNVDSLASIKAIAVKPNHITYKSSNLNNGFAVFSEIFYENGWNAYINGNLVPHYRVNYLLRGLLIPSGDHMIDFKFEPTLVKTGSRISLASSILFLFILVGGFYKAFRGKKHINT